MEFEKMPTNPTPEKKIGEEEFGEKTNKVEDSEALKEKLKEIDEKRRELDKRYEETNNQEEIAKIEEEHQQLSEQSKEIEEKISGLGKKEAEEKVPSEEKVKEQLEKMGASLEMEKILQNPEALSEILSEGDEILKNPDVQKKYLKLKDAISKATEKKEEVPDSVAKAKKHIEKKESVWKTAFGTVGWIILLFLVLSMLAELKGVNYLIDQSGGKKK